MLKTISEKFSINRTGTQTHSRVKAKLWIPEKAHFSTDKIKRKLKLDYTSLNGGYQTHASSSRPCSVNCDRRAQQSEGQRNEGGKMLVVFLHMY